MTLIKVSIKRDVTALPLKKISSQDYDGRGSTRNDEGCIGQGRSDDVRIVEKRIFMVSHVTFPSVCG
jgi:hypothetical protein